jgi:hypothetical protein
MESGLALDREAFVMSKSMYWQACPLCTTGNKSLSTGPLSIQPSATCTYWEGSQRGFGALVSFLCGFTPDAGNQADRKRKAHVETGVIPQGMDEEVDE